MVGLKFVFKPKELKKAFNEQKHSGRVVVSIPIREDDDEFNEMVPLYESYVYAYARRGELEFGRVVTSSKVDKVMVERNYGVRVIAAVKTEKEYQISIRFDDKDLFT